jgi:hypothetical protein
MAASLLVFAVSACVDPKIGPYYNPDDAVAPVLSSLDSSSYTMAESDTMATFEFTAADWGVSIGTSYKLYACLSGNDFEKAYSLGSSTSSTDGITVMDKDMNNVLISLGCEAGVAADIDFRIVATMTGTEATDYQLFSNTLTASLTAYNAEKVYDNVYVLGVFNSWSHDTALHLYNYAEDGVYYSGAVDFGEDYATNSFKITGAAGWDNSTGNWGVATVSTDVDPASTQLLNGSNDNITNYTGHRYYSFTLNKNSLLLTCNLAFDQIGVVGIDGDWDNDVVMAYSSYKQRFYVDVQIASATTFKFRADGAWDNCWGGDKNGLTSTGDNIPIDSGNYRIYFDLNNWSTPTCTISASAYGTEEGGGSSGGGSTTTDNAWSVIGVNGDWTTDYYMTRDGSVWTSSALTLDAASEFKLRFNNDWGDANVTGAAADDGTVTVGDSMAVAHPGNNFKITDAGVYVISYDTTAEAVIVKSMGDKWSVIGMIGDSEWDTDYYMTESDGVWTSDAITINGEFKLRYNGGWDENRGAGGDSTLVVTLGEPFTAVSGGQNISVPATGEDYIVVYNSNDETITVSAALPSDTWSLIGDIAGTGWGTDFFMTEKSSGIWVSDPVTLTAGSGFKVRYNHDWTVNRGAGGDVEPYALSAGSPVTAVQNGKNLTVSEDGTYTVIYDANDEQIYLAGWSAIGAIEGSSWDTDFFMKKDSEGIWTSDPILISGEFKIRYNCDWSVNKGGTNSPEALTPLTGVTGVDGGSNFTAPEEGYYRVVYNENDGSVMIQRCFWGVIGVVGTSNWDADYFLVETEEGKWSTVSPVTINGEFKIRYKCDWTVNRGADADATYTVTPGTAFGVKQDGANMAVPETGMKYNVSYDATAEQVTVTAAE